MSVENIDSTNIFDELSSWNIKEEITKVNKEGEKNMYYYLWILSFFIKTINILAIISLLCFWAYYFVQNNKEFYNNTYLDPFCGLLLNSTSWMDETYCSSVESLIAKYETKNKELQTEYAKSILDMIWDVYSLSNFKYSRDVSFLVEKSTSRLMPIDIIGKFDAIKNKFEPIDKSKIQCSNLSILENGNFSVSCDAYSSEWDTNNIVWFRWESWNFSLLNGTSISVAGSFINYIQTTSKDFYIISKPKSFTTETVSWYGNYTKKTSFELELWYKSNNSL